jgi:hypothetical protein
MNGKPGQLLFRDQAKTVTQGLTDLEDTQRAAILINANY